MKKIITGEIYAIILYGKVMFAGNFRAANNYAKNLSMQYKKLDISIVDKNNRVCQVYRRGRSMMCVKPISTQENNYSYMSAYALARKMCLPMYHVD